MYIAFSGTKLVNSAFFHTGSTVAFPPGICYNDVKNSAEVLSVKKCSAVLLLMLLLTTGCRREVPEETALPTVPEATQSTTVPETTAVPTVAQTEPIPVHSALWNRKSHRAAQSVSLMQKEMFSEWEPILRNPVYPSACGVSRNRKSEKNFSQNSCGKHIYYGKLSSAERCRMPTVWSVRNPMGSPV